MIRLSFAIGGGYRKIVIDGRIITMLTIETGYVPIKIDLDKLEEVDKKIKNKMGKEGIKLLKEISLLESEEDIVIDIKKDFQKSGWRLIKKENGVV